MFRRPLSIYLEGPVNMCQVVHNFRRPLRICAKWCTNFGGFCEYVPGGAQLSEASANMCKVVHNFRRPLRIFAKWCTTFGGLCEYVPSGAQLSESFANVCQVVYNFRRPLRICAKWCTTFGGLCQFEPNGVYIHCPLRICVWSCQYMMNSGSQPNSIANLYF